MNEETTPGNNTDRLSTTVSGRLHKLVGFFVRIKLIFAVTSTSFINGHKVWFDWLFYKWRYVDNNKTTKETRPCIRCKKDDIEGHDACLSNLPGVKNACCGHGVGDGYINFVDGRIIRGRFTVE